MRGGEAGLVRLQMADELPADDRGALRPFVHALLHAVLADSGKTIAGGIFDRGGRLGLGHRQQLHFRRNPARLAAGFGDLFLHGGCPLPKSFIIAKH